MSGRAYMELAKAASRVNGRGALVVAGIDFPMHVDTIDHVRDPLGNLTGLKVVCSSTDKLDAAAYSYIAYDVMSTKANLEARNARLRPAIKSVVFNDPATIVFWSDGTKTVVKKGEGDVFDPEKGLAMAIAKRALGNQGSYFNEFKKWIK